MRLGLGVIGASERTAPSDQDLAAMRVEAARRCGRWRELDASRLVRRKLGRRGLWVDASSDEAFQAYRGSAFSRGRVVSDMTALFYVIERGDVVLVLERLGKSWSELLYEHERLAARAKAAL
jgi:hypothetical protein